jgi:hypothetical protein
VHMSRSNFITLIVKASSNNQKNYYQRDGRLLKLYQSSFSLEELIESARTSENDHETLFMEIETDKIPVHTLE